MIITRPLYEASGGIQSQNEEVELILRRKPPLIILRITNQSLQKFFFFFEMTSHFLNHLRL